MHQNTPSRNFKELRDSTVENDDTVETEGRFHSIDLQFVPGVWRTVYNIYMTNAKRDLGRMSLKWKNYDFLATEVQKAPHVPLVVGDMNAIVRRYANQFCSDILYKRNSEVFDKTPSCTESESVMLQCFLDNTELEVIPMNRKDNDCLVHPCEGADCIYSFYGTRDDFRRGRGFNLDYILEPQPADRKNSDQQREGGHGIRFYWKNESEYRVKILSTVRRYDHMMLSLRKCK